jgi:hypothetical protein
MIRCLFQSATAEYLRSTVANKLISRCGHRYNTEPSRSLTRNYQRAQLEALSEELQASLPELLFSSISTLPNTYHK